MRAPTLSVRVRRTVSESTRSPLATSIERVVEGDNCSGCGACALLSPSVEMRLDAKGFLRPQWVGPDAAPAADAAAVFARICPGVGVAAPPAGPQRHPTLGSYVSVWAAWSTDPAIRLAGSSGGVLTALAGWLLATGKASTVIGAGAAGPGSTRSAARRLRSSAEVGSAAGSRYAPTANAALFDPDPTSVFIGKPCEVSAVRQLSGGHRVDVPAPVLLSFFCAGVPSQNATDDLVAHLGLVPGEVRELRYRGNGWPGDFTAVDRAGTTVRTSYEQSWGAHLGKQIQSRCKICPDGTGTNADISVGDLWDSDAAGYPVFTSEGGRSVAIARTARGHELLTAARDAGIVVLEAVDMTRVAAVQPLQDRRVRMLLGRLAGKRLARRAVPRFRGFRLWRLALRSPGESLRSLRGSYRRSTGGSS